MWRADPSLDLSGLVDSAKLFEFVQELLESGEQWVFSFGKPDEITQILRAQFAYLFMDALTLRTKARDPNLSALFRSCSGPMLRLVVERPPYWEYLLFGEALKEALQEHDDLRRDWHYGLTLGTSISATGSEFNKRAQSRMSDALTLAGNVEVLIQQVLPEAVGPPGVAGDGRKILYTAARLGSLYREALEWKFSFRRIEVPSELRKLRDITGNLLDEVVQGIESFVDQYNEMLKTAIAELAKGEPVRINLTIRLGVSGLELFKTESARILELVRAGRIEWQ